MTPEEELQRLNKLIRQYETVYRTTPDADQKERVERQLKELQSYRQKILTVNVIENTGHVEQPDVEDELTPYPILRGLVAENSAAPPQRALASFAMKDAAATSSQKDMFHLTLYARQFEREFLPFLTEKQLKLDFKFSMDRDSFYNSYQSFQRKIDDYREEIRRLADGMVSRDMDLEIRKRILKSARFIAADAARFFRAIERFAAELTEDATGDAVKCLNCDAEVSFDSIEGTRLLQGRTVSEALAELRDLAEEAVAYLNIPDIESQENERADRH